MRASGSDGDGPDRLRRRALPVCLILLMSLGLAVSSPGCRLLQTRSGSSLTETAARLRWELTAEADGLYQAAIYNPRRSSVSLVDVELHLSARIASPDGHRATGPATRPPATIAGRGDVVVPVSLPTGPTWPDEFAVILWVTDRGTGETMPVAERLFRPGAFGLVWVRPAGGSVDFPVSGVFEVELALPVKLEALGSNLTIEPAVRLEVVMVHGWDTRGGPGGFEDEAESESGKRFEVRPVGGLAPFTRYSLTVGPDLKSADGLMTMGRPYGVIFSTGPTVPDQWTWAPVWSPDGARIAWTQPADSRLATLWVGETTSMTASVRSNRVAGGVPAWDLGGDRLYCAFPEGDGLAVGFYDLTTRSTGILVEAVDLEVSTSLRLLSSPSGLYLAIEASLGAVDVHSDVCRVVYVHNFDSGVLTRLPADGLTSILVGWLGDKVLYASTHEGYDHSHHYRYDLYLYDVTKARREIVLGGGQLTNVGGFSVALSAPLCAYWTWETVPHDPDLRHRPAALWLVGEVGQDPASVPVVLRGESQSYRQASLSPDGTMIAAAWVHEASWDIVLLYIQREGRKVTSVHDTVLAFGQAAQFAPAWSPDGSRLAYVEALGSSVRVLVISPTTRETFEFTTTRP